MCLGWLLGKGVTLAVRYCKSCGHEFELQARFCSNCGTPRPTSPLTKAEPAPTLTPEEILATLEEEEGEQEQAAEAPSEESPKPGPLPGIEPLKPPLAPASPESGSEPSSANDTEGGARLILTLIIGAMLAAICLAAGLGGGPSLVVGFAVVVLIRLVQWDRRQREKEKLRSASVPTASEMVPPHGLNGEGGLSRVPTPEADVAVPPLPERTAEGGQEKPPSQVGAGTPPDRTGGGGDTLIKLFAATCTGLIFVALLWGLLAMGGVGLDPGVGFLVFLVLAALSFSTIETGEKRGTPIGSVPPVRSRSIPQWVKIAVATRDGGTCRNCGSAHDLQYDHIIPFSRGGSSTDVTNIQLLCGKCNRRKSNRYIG